MPIGAIPMAMPALPNVRSCTIHFDNVPNPHCLRHVSRVLPNLATLHLSFAHSWVNDLWVVMDVLAPLEKFGSLQH